MLSLARKNIHTDYTVNTWLSIIAYKMLISRIVTCVASSFKKYICGMNSKLFFCLQIKFSNFGFSFPNFSAVSWDTLPGLKKTKVIKWSYIKIKLTLLLTKKMWTALLAYSCWLCGQWSPHPKGSIDKSEGSWDSPFYRKKKGYISNKPLLNTQISW